MRMVALRFLALVVVAMSAMAVSGSVHAHDLWLTTEGGANARRVVVNYGHPRDRPPTAADKILDLVAITGDKRLSLMDGLVAGSFRGAPIVQSKTFPDGGRTLLAARYDNGYWVKIGDNLYRNASKRMAPNAIDSLWSAKFAKAVTGADAPWSTVIGHDLEIVPLADPATARPRENLRVRVLFRGQPLAGAEVERGDGLTPVKEDELPRSKTVRMVWPRSRCQRPAPSCLPSTIACRLRIRPTWQRRTFTMQPCRSTCARVDPADLPLHRIERAVRHQRPDCRQNLGDRLATSLPKILVQNLQND
jgi:nickel transport protein